MSAREISIDKFMIMTCSHPLDSSIESYFDTVGVVEHETHHR